MTRSRLWLTLAAGGFAVRAEGIRLYVRPRDRLTPQLTEAIQLHRWSLVRWAGGELPESCGACGRTTGEVVEVNGVAVTKCATCSESFPAQVDWLRAVGLPCTT